MYHRFFTETENLTGNLCLCEEDGHHIKNVLRLRPGAVIIVCNGKGFEAECRLDGSLSPVARDVFPSKGEPDGALHIYPSVAKGERFEWLLQKAVELGATDITPVLSERCIVPAPEAKKMQRWKRIVKSAAEQSGRGIIPRLHDSKPFEGVARIAEGLRLFCYEEEQKKAICVLLSQNKTNSISILTGPEGGYTPGEAALCLANGWEAVSLGERILRCETAPLFVLAAIGYERMKQKRCP